MPPINMKDIIIENLEKSELEKRLAPLKAKRKRHEFIASDKKPAKFVRVDEPVQAEKTIEKTVQKPPLTTKERATLNEKELYWEQKIDEKKVKTMWKQSPEELDELLKIRDKLYRGQEQIAKKPIIAEIAKKPVTASQVAKQPQKGGFVLDEKMKKLNEQYIEEHKKIQQAQQGYTKEQQEMVTYRQTKEEVVNDYKAFERFLKKDSAKVKQQQTEKPLKNIPKKQQAQEAQKAKQPPTKQDEQPPPIPQPQPQTQTSSNTKDLNSFIPWLITSTGIGSLLSIKAEAKEIPLFSQQKCPTLRQVKKVASQLDKAKKEYNSIKNKTQDDSDKQNKIINQFLEVKEKYTQCQNLNYYK